MISSGWRSQGDAAHSDRSAMSLLPRFTLHPRIAPRRSVYDAVLSTWPEGEEPPWDTYYYTDYIAVFKEIARRADPHYEQSVIRQLCKDDLFFLVYFIMEVPGANHPFVVGICNEIEADGGCAHTGCFHNYAREHFKTVCLTIALTIKRILNNPEHTTAIFSYKKPAAEDILSAIKGTLEKEIMVQCFPDILYGAPKTESQSWSLQNGIRVKRTSVSRKEETVQGFGLIEGMPTGGHFDHRIYDDVETFDIAESPEQMAKCFSAFEMSDNLGTDGGTELIIGTYYSHIGPLVRIRDKKAIDGSPMYRTVIKPATHDGTRTGTPVLLSQERLDKLQMSKHFEAQQLCNPTPGDEVTLESKWLKYIEPQFMPKDRYKFLLIDQAGGKDTQVAQRKGDKWTIAVVSVRPLIDDIGASDVYLEDFESAEMAHAAAIHEIIRMYLDSGYIRAVGVEKVGLSTTEIHIKAALLARGRRISEETRTLILLRPAGRDTEKRVGGALAWPLANGKLYVSAALADEKQKALVAEMDKFPYYHSEIINTWAYVYDIINTYRFKTAGDKPKKSVTNMMAAGRCIRGVGI